MKFRTLAGALLFLGVLSVAAVAAVEVNRASHMGIVYFTRPTLVAGKVLVGKVLIVHDDAKMARGEPCTSIYRPRGGSQPEELVSFMCRPEARPVAEKLTVRCVRNNNNLMTDVMTEYQFAGEAEAHAVPAIR